MVKVESKITASGLARRQALYYPIECRGILVDTKKLEAASKLVTDEIEENLKIASSQWGMRLYVGAENSVFERTKLAVREGRLSKDMAPLIVKLQANKEFNIRSPDKFLSFLTKVGYKIPKITKKDKDGEWSQEESTSELALRQLIRDNQFKYPQGDAALIAVLNVRELLTLKSRYLNARLFPRTEGMVFLSSYNAGSGTLTGRRSSKKHIYGYGGNAQNIPKHSRTARLFRECLISRPEKIFLSVDQISAEDWPVSALANNTMALDELSKGVDRHTKLAAFIFNVAIDSKSSQEWKDSIERYLGKKTRHANNYGMQASRMHDSLMTEGKYFSVDLCKSMLERANAADPSIKGVFHKYVENTLSNSRTLCTPFGRERVFLGLRPNAKNGNLLNEAYSYIPQSIVGDNTGFAVEELQLSCDEFPFSDIIQEGHDSIVQEVSYDGSSIDKIHTALNRTIESFDRPIKFHNGIEINIPVEAELGWDFAKSVKIKSLDARGIAEALQELGERN
jgi:DNA polymerase family A